MGSKRIGLARTQALIENLKRQLNMSDSGISLTTLDVSGASVSCTIRSEQLIRKQVTEATNADAAATVTAADIKKVIVKCTPTSARSKATATAETLISTLGLTDQDDCVDFYLLNLSTTDSHIITLTAGSGVTLVGNAKVNPIDQAADAVSTGSSHWRVRRTSAPSATDAVTVYRLA